MTKAQLDLLVLAWQDGRSEAFVLLYQFYQPKLCHFAAYLLGNSAVAEDLVQNVWLKLSRRLQRLEDPRLFASWLYKAVRWEVLDWQKSASQRRQVPLDETTEALLWYTPAEQDSGLYQAIATLAPAEQDPGLYQAIATLAPAEQLVLLLHYFHQCELTEIALILNLPTGTVKSRLFRARQQLKQQLDGDYDEQ
jgi:RNA polymerase sigma-70 factor (ECF subfamily)